MAVGMSQERPESLARAGLEFFRAIARLLVRESVALEGAPHRRSATGLPGPDLSGKGSRSTL